MQNMMAIVRPCGAGQIAGLVLTAMCVAPCAILNAGGERGTIVFVDASLTTGKGDGSSWSNAFQGRLGLQHALQSIRAGATAQIWIADGEYAPALPGGSRDASFIVAAGIALFGGFAGGETLLRQRDPVGNPTILTGDLNDDDPPGELPFGATSGPPTIADNSRHVLRLIQAAAVPALNGLILERGHSDLSDDWGANLRVEGGAPIISQCVIRHGVGWAGGGGASIIAASPTLTNCTFIDNHSGYGGGVLHAGGSSAVFDGCRFEHNGGNGAGIYNGEPFSSPARPSTLVIRRCDFLANGDGADFGTGAGIGIFDRGGELTIESCKFVDNKTVAGGGGMYLLRSRATVINSVFVGNEGAGDGGGAIYADAGIFDGKTPGPNLPPILFAGCQMNGNNGAMFIGSHVRIDIVNCTIAHNTPGRWWESWPAFAMTPEASVRLVNTIVWGHTPIPHEVDGVWNFKPGLSGVLLGAGKLTADRCRIEFWDGSIAGAGTTDHDPLFVDALGADGMPGTADDNLRASASSSCIDAGDDSAMPGGVKTDLDGHSRFVDGDDDGIVSIDIGAFERAAPVEPADLNHDGHVNGLDLALHLAQWTGALTYVPCPPLRPADLNHDCSVNGLDLASLLAAWG